MTRILGLILTGLVLPMTAMAEDAVIRIEAKRGAAATEAAVAGWRDRFDDVVTFPLQGGWTGIALGPMEAGAAAARLAELQAQGAVPSDSFVAAVVGGMSLSAVAPVQDGTTEDAETAPQSATDSPAAVVLPQNGFGLHPFDAAPTGLQAPSHHLRLEAFEDRAEADAALARWRENFPGASLWHLPNGWFAITLGPLREETAKAWLTALKPADLLPNDVFLADTAELGEVLAKGQESGLADPPAEPAPLPPLDQVQRVLRWAGYYDGAIDGQGGPKTRAAIAMAIAVERQSPDPGTAMHALMDRRAAWRDEMGLTELRDDHTGLSLNAPMQRLAFDRTERALSIYGPRDGSGAALILFSQPGGQQELQDLAGLVTALGWVPSPERQIRQGNIFLKGQNEAHIGEAHGRVLDGRAEGWVLIWPVSDAQNQPRIAAELADSLIRQAPAANDPLVSEELPSAGPDGPMPLPAN